MWGKKRHTERQLSTRLVTTPTAFLSTSVLGSVLLIHVWCGVVTDVVWCVRGVRGVPEEDSREARAFAAVPGLEEDSSTRSPWARSAGVLGLSGVQRKIHQGFGHRVYVNHAPLPSCSSGGARCVCIAFAAFPSTTPMYRCTAGSGQGCMPTFPRCHRAARRGQDTFTPM